MFPELFRIPGTPISIHGFGLMVVIGLLLGSWLAKRLANRIGLDGEAFANAAILALVAGIAGARLSHVLENFHQYTDPHRSAFANLKDAVNLTSGGLTYYGGFLLATPVLIIYARRKHIPIRTGMDIIAPALMVGLAFGRLGCFLNGCCYGAETTVPWAITFPYGSIPYVDQVYQGKLSAPEQLINVRPDGHWSLLTPEDAKKEGGAAAALAQTQHSLPVHPAQIYSFLTGILLAGICVAHFTTPHAPGRTFALMMMLEGAARFALESVRVEPAVVANLSYSMVLGIGIVGVGLLLWLVFGELARRRGDLPPWNQPLSPVVAA